MSRLTYFNGHVPTPYRISLVARWDRHGGFGFQRNRALDPTHLVGLYRGGPEPVVHDTATIIAVTKPRWMSFPAALCFRMDGQLGHGCRVRWR